MVKSRSLTANAVRLHLLSSKSQLNIINKILNIEGMTVTAYKVIDEIGYFIYLESNQSKAACPHCNNKSDKLHQNHPLTVRDLPLGEHDVYLKINRRQFKCMVCDRKFSEEFNFIKKRSHFTNRTKQKIVEEILSSDIKNVAKRNGLSEQEVETIMKEAGAGLAKKKPENLKRLGIDEIAFVKGQKNYCAVLVDLDKKELIAIEHIFPELTAMHKMKELFRDIFESKIDWGNGLIKLGNWLKDACLKFPKSCGTIKRWIGEIVAYFDNRTTQGVVEGINNKLKLIKRMGYGFRNFDNFQIRSLLAWHFNY